MTIDRNEYKYINTILYYIILYCNYTIYTMIYSKFWAPVMLFFRNDPPSSWHPPNSSMPEHLASSESPGPGLAPFWDWIITIWKITKHFSWVFESTNNLWPLIIIRHWYYGRLDWSNDPIQNPQHGMVIPHLFPTRTRKPIVASCADWHHWWLREKGALYCQWVPPDILALTTTGHVVTILTLTYINHPDMTFIHQWH